MRSTRVFANLGTLKMKSESEQLLCGCKELVHQTKFIVITGGPGAGKTAALEMVKKSFCNHVVILPEAASILFSGGFCKSVVRGVGK